MKLCFLRNCLPQHSCSSLHFSNFMHYFINTYGRTGSPIITFSNFWKALVKSSFHPGEVRMPASLVAGGELLLLKSKHNYVLFGQADHMVLTYCPSLCLILEKQISLQRTHWKKCHWKRTENSCTKMSWLIPVLPCRFCTIQFCSGVGGKMFPSEHF